MLGYVVHLSGHKELTKEIFEEKYVPKIKALNTPTTKYYIGATQGFGEMSMNYLLDDLVVPPKNIFMIYRGGPVTNYLTATVIGFRDFTERDEYITDNTYNDIIFINGDYASLKGNVAANIVRREFGCRIAKEYVKFMRNYTESPDGTLKLYDVIEDFFRSLKRHNPNVDTDRLICALRNASIHWVCDSILLVMN